jgi:hypothetical protein
VPKELLTASDGENTESSWIFVAKILLIGYNDSLLNFTIERGWINYG